jgi:hypothetical protein
MGVKLPRAAVTCESLDDSGGKTGQQCVGLSGCPALRRFVDTQATMNDFCATVLVVSPPALRLLMDPFRSPAT